MGGCEGGGEGRREDGTGGHAAPLFGGILEMKVSPSQTNHTLSPHLMRGVSPPPRFPHFLTSAVSALMASADARWRCYCTAWPACSTYRHPPRWRCSWTGCDYWLRGVRMVPGNSCAGCFPAHISPLLLHPSPSLPSRPVVPSPAGSMRLVLSPPRHTPPAPAHGADLPHGVSAAAARLHGPGPGQHAVGGGKVGPKWEGEVV